MQRGEIQTIQQFYKIPRDERPKAKDTVFFCTHEPCSLCASPHPPSAHRLVLVETFR